MTLERFGGAQDVSLFFFVLGIPGVGMSLAVPWLVSRYTRRGTFPKKNCRCSIGSVYLFTQVNYSY